MIIALVIVFLVLLCCAANFSALEGALFSLRERQSLLLQRMADEGDPVRAALLNNPGAWLHEVFLLGGALNLLLAAVGLQLITGPLQLLNWSPWLTAPLMFGFGLLAVEILPQALATRSPERIIRATLPLFFTLRRLVAPVTHGLTRLSEALLRQVTPRRLVPHAGMVAEEIETLIEMREEQRVITAAEATVLQEIVTLADLMVKDCMTARVDLPLMPHDARDDEARRMIESARLRFVPVFDEKLDLIVGLVDTEVWRLARRPAWQTIVQQPALVPETMSALDALRLHLAGEGSAVVIVDEYGGFEGLLTRGNLVERLVSKVAPLQSTELAIRPLGEGHYLVSGAARIDEVNRELDVNLDDEGMDTIGGLIFTRFGYLPRPGEFLNIGNISIKVKRTAHNRIQQIELTVREEDESP